MKKAAAFLVPLLLSLPLASCVEKGDIFLGTWTIPESGIGTMKDEYEGTLKVTLSDEENGNFLSWNGSYYLLELSLVDQGETALPCSLDGFLSGTMQGLLTIGESRYRTSVALLTYNGVDAISFMGPSAGSEPLFVFTKGGVAVASEALLPSPSSASEGEALSSSIPEAKSE